MEILRYTYTVWRTSFSPCGAHLLNIVGKGLHGCTMSLDSAPQRTCRWWENFRSLRPDIRTCHDCYSHLSIYGIRLDNIKLSRGRDRSYETLARLFLIAGPSCQCRVWSWITNNCSQVILLRKNKIRFSGVPILVSHTKLHSIIPAKRELEECIWLWQN